MKSLIINAETAEDTCQVSSTPIAIHNCDDTNNEKCHETAACIDYAISIPIQSCHIIIIVDNNIHYSSKLQ